MKLLCQNKMNILLYLNKKSFAAALRVRDIIKIFEKFMVAEFALDFNIKTEFYTQFSIKIYELDTCYRKFKFMNVFVFIMVFVNFFLYSVAVISQTYIIKNITPDIFSNDFKFDIEFKMFHSFQTIFASAFIK